jgi:hypothetical protein
MAQARNRGPDSVRRVRADDWSFTSGPVLPGEYRPLAPVPAASEPSDPPILTEAECLRLLVKHYRWTWLGKDRLLKWNPHGRAIRAEVEALGDG